MTNFTVNCGKKKGDFLVKKTLILVFFLIMSSMLWSQEVFFNGTDRAFGSYQGMYGMSLGYLNENNLSSTEFFELFEKTYNHRQVEVREQSTLYRLFENAQNVISTNEGVLRNGDAFQVVITDGITYYMFVACQFNNRLYYRAYRLENS